MGLGSLKSKASGKAPAAKASKTAVVTASNIVEDALRDFHAAKAKEKQAKAEIADAEARMIDEVQELRVRHSRSVGENTPSIRLSAGSQQGMFTQKKQFKKMTDENTDALKAVVGAVNFSKWFREDTTFSFDEAALKALPNADKIADAIVTALGDHVHILKVETAIVPTAQFADDTTLNDAAADAAEKLQSQGLAIPYKGSFK